jgi:hypothetical protein
MVIKYFFGNSFHDSQRLKKIYAKFKIQNSKKKKPNTKAI